MKPLIGYQDHVLRGSANRYAKLDESKVRSIKQALAQGKPRKQVALEYGASRQTVDKIANGYAWWHVTVCE